MSNDIEILLSDKRVRKLERFQILQDVASTIALVPAGLARIHSAGSILRVFAFAELAAVAVLIVATVRELRDGDDDITGIGWTNLIVGGIIVAESLLQSYEGVSKIVRPALLTGITSIGLGLVQSRLRKRRAGYRMIRISDERLVLRLGKFRRLDCAWSDIERIEDAGDTIVITPRNGRTRKISRKRYDNFDDIRTALLDRATLRSVPLLR